MMATLGMVVLCRVGLILLLVCVRGRGKGGPSAAVGFSLFSGLFYGLEGFLGLFGGGGGWRCPSWGAVCRRVVWWGGVVFRVVSGWLPG